MLSKSISLQELCRSRKAARWRVVLFGLFNSQREAAKVE